MKTSCPYAKIVDVVDNYFGMEVKDPYRWLENAEDPGEPTPFASSSGGEP